MDLFQQRIAKLAQSIKNASCDAFLVEDPINLLYLTGQNLSAGKLLVCLSGSVLAVDGRYFEMCKSQCPIPVILSDPAQGLLQLIKFFEGNPLHRIGVCGSLITYQRYLDLKSEISEINKEQSGQIELKPLQDLLAQIRMIKGPEEIQKLRDAANLGSAGFDFVCSVLKEGISEEEVASELEIFWKRKGSQKTAFDPIIAFGPNSSMPHYRAGKDRLKKGQNILIDIGVTFQHYHSDMTRVVYYGDPDPSILEIHRIVMEAQLAAFKLCKPGTSIGDLDGAARGIIASKGYGDNFTHSLGHGVGLEIHEAPTLRNKSPFKEMPLKAGMVITIEPGIYLPGIGGIRLEDTVVITEKGYENLTNRPTEARVIG